jgi:hypothetical protein
LAATRRNSARRVRRPGARRAALLASGTTGAERGDAGLGDAGLGDTALVGMGAASS